MLRARGTLAVAVLIVVLTGCGPADGGEDEAASPAPTVTVTSTVTATPDSASASDGAASDADPCAEVTGSGGESLAFVFVTSPPVGAAVESGFEVTGCANAFEANYQWQLLDRDGNELAADFGTATCGTGCVGELSFTVDYTVDQLQVGTLRVFTTSARDGSEQDINSIPLRLQP